MMEIVTAQERQHLITQILMVMVSVMKMIAGLKILHELMGQEIIVMMGILLHIMIAMMTIAIA